MYVRAGGRTPTAPYFYHHDRYNGHHRHIHRHLHDHVRVHHILRGRHLRYDHSLHVRGLHGSRLLRDLHHHDAHSLHGRDLYLLKICRFRYYLHKSTACYTYCIYILLKFLLNKIMLPRTPTQHYLVSIRSDLKSTILIMMLNWHQLFWEFCTIAKK